jgi:hypothetical protein
MLEFCIGTLPIPVDGETEDVPIKSNHFVEVLYKNADHIELRAHGGDAPILILCEQLKLEATGRTGMRLGSRKKTEARKKPRKSQKLGTSFVRNLFF